MTMFTLLTPLTYWLLIAIWTFILFSYFKRLSSVRLRGSLILFLLLIPTLSHAVENTLDLTSEEQAWLEEHPNIRIGIMDVWPPFGFIDEDGTPGGIDVDYIKALNGRLGGSLEIVPGEWKVIYDDVKEKRLDALMDITPKPEREEQFNFTAPYLDVPHVIVARRDVPFLKNEEELRGKVLALERGFGNVDFFRKNYPEVQIKEYRDTSHALGAVARDEADAYTGNRTVALYLIEKEVMANLKVHGRLKKSGSILAIGARKDWPILRNILQKGLDDISKEEKRTIIGKWVISEEEKPVEPLVVFTDEEKSWLKAHPLIRVAMHPNWAPVEFRDEQGSYQGMSMTYLQRLEELLGVRLEVAEGLTWQQAMEGVRNKDLDFFTSVAKTLQREEYALFIRPYLSMPINIFARNDVSYIGSLDNLVGKPVTVVDGYAIHDWLSSDYPELKLVPAKSPPEALKMVSAGEVDVFVGNIVTTSYYLGKLRLHNVRVAGETPYSYAQSMAVRNDWPLFAGILQKGLDAIEESEKEAIYNNWMSIRYEHGFDYTLLWQVLVVAGLLLAITLYWNRRLAGEVTKRKRAEKVLRFDEERLGALLSLSRIKVSHEKEFIEFALEEGVRITESKVGYLHFFMEDKKDIGLYLWSKEVLKICKAEKMPHYPLEEAGIWADCARRREPVIHNDYQNHPGKKGYPEGHFPVIRHMSVPVFDGEKIVAIAGVGNKEKPYSEGDARQLTLYMNNMWGILKEKRAEEELQKRTKELEGLNKMMLGREFRVIELKEEVNKLCEELGRGKVYPPIWGEKGGKGE